ncbi:MAG: hypothetical protein ACR2RV_24040 [Verrucomicrobiales bacterium]
MIKDIGVVVGLAVTLAAQAPAQENVKPIPAQEESIAAIKELGGKFTDGGKRLNLRGTRGTKVTDAGLVHLKGMTGLTTLGLAGAQITDAGLVHLEGMTGLVLLGLNLTKVTKAGVEKLKAALPKCKISHDTIP